ncbi:MAG TPA: hypothetical protein VIM14_12515, partial [Polyangia bacterium]
EGRAATTEPNVKVIATGAHPCAMATDDRMLYWFDRKGSILRVPKTGGHAFTIVRGRDQPEVCTLRLDDGYLYWSEAGTVLRVRTSGGPAVIVGKLDEETSNGVPVSGPAVSIDTVNMGGETLERLSVQGPAGELRVLDACPVSKTSCASDGRAVFWSEEPAASDQTNVAKIVRLDLAKSRRPTYAARNQLDEAAYALRGWLRAAERGEMRTPKGILVMHLDYDIISDMRWSGSVASAGGLSAVISRLKKAGHGLFRFEHRCWDWRLLSARQQRRLPFPNTGAQTLEDGDIVIRSHQNSNGCPFIELTAVMRRFERGLLPVLLFYRSGYDCE